MPWWRSHWGRRAAGGYILLVAAASGFATYHLLFAASRFQTSGSLLIGLGLPWSRTLTPLVDATSSRAIWLVLVLSFALNAVMLCFIGSRFEQLARGERR
jgi:hypothetical protein